MIILEEKLTFRVNLLSEFHRFRGRKINVRRCDSKNDCIWIRYIVYNQISHLFFDVSWLIFDGYLRKINDDGFERKGIVEFYLGETWKID